MNQLTGSFTVVAKVAAIAVLSWGLSGCGKATDAVEGISDSTSNTVETAASEAGSQATASESNGSVGFSGASPAASADYLDPSDTIHPFAACTYSSARSACASNADTITFNGCTVAGGAVSVTGSSAETFSGTSAASCTVPVANGGAVRRTSSGITLTLVGGASLTTDTTGGTAWDGTVIPSTGTLVSNTAGTRTIVIDGTHRKLTGPKGRTWFDHFITSTGLTVTGTRAAGTRAIAGSARLYHNLAKYTANNTFNTVTWGTPTCCYPTSGTITSTFTGSKTGNSTMTFTSTCGAATFVDTDGTSSNVTLTQCN